MTVFDIKALLVTAGLFLLSTDPAIMFAEATNIIKSSQFKERGLPKATGFFYSHRGRLVIKLRRIRNKGEPRNGKNIDTD